MPIKFNCHQCGARLRVPEQHIGMKARCPKCSAHCVVPEVSQPSDESLDEDFNDLEAPLASDSQTAGAAISADAPEATVAVPPLAANKPASDAFSTAADSPYAATTSIGKPNFATAPSSAYQPLYEARTMMKIFGWTNLVIGVIYCITIVGILVGWLFVWLGWLVKGAGEAITIGVETGDSSQIRLANQRIATYFRIMGVLTLIGLAFFALYILVGVIALIIAITGAASGV